jgi:hypothetical protein
MSNRATTFAKRQREMEQKDRAKEREAKRVERRARKTNDPSDKSGEEDPDLAGIVHGPQPIVED